MGKDPAFLFYPNDFIGGTMGWTLEEKGAYLELLILQFNRGHMTSHMARHMVGQLWDTIKVKFEEDDKGLYFNRRLEFEKNKRSAYVSSRSNNLEGHNQYTKKGHKTGHMTSHMENENRNENINVIKDNKWEFLLNTEFNNTFIDYLDMRKKIRKPATERAQNLILKDLHKHDIDTARLMLEQSIKNSWQGVFELKQEKKMNMSGLTRNQLLTANSMRKLEERLKMEEESANKDL